MTTALSRFPRLRSASLGFLAACLLLGGARLDAGVSDLAAFFSAGQTFVTWTQPEDSAAHYDVYRNGRKLATVGAHTSLNIMANVDRLKLSNTRAPAVYELPQRTYFVIRENQPPLDARTGLYVHTAKKEEEAVYVVTPTGEAPSAATPAVRVSERVAFPSAVRQNELDFVHWTDDVGTALYPAMSSLPSVPYNFRVRAPQGPGPHPLIAFLHGALMHYTKTLMGGEAEAGAVRIALDSPIMRGEIRGLEGERWPVGAWHGYNENWGTGRPETSGQVVDYVARRVLWTLDWAARNYPVDPDRVSLRGGSMGGIGALALGLRFPERFAAIHAHMPPLRMAGQGGLVALMFPLVPADFIAALEPSRELPFILVTAGRTDQIVGWPDKLEFTQVLRSARRGFTLYWDMRNHDGTYTGAVPPQIEGPAVIWGRTPGRPEMSVVTFSRRQSHPAIDRLSVDSDPGTVNFGVRPNQRPPFETPGAGDLIGSFNGAVDWDRDTLIDASDRWEITLRLLPIVRAERATATVTPRRLQQLQPRAGESFRYAWRDGKETRSGMLTADRHGLLTVPDVPITPAGVRLEIVRHP